MYSVPKIRVRIREHMSEFWVQLEHDGFTSDVTGFFDSREAAFCAANSAFRTARAVLNIVHNRCTALNAQEAWLEDEKGSEIPIDDGNDPG